MIEWLILLIIVPMIVVPVVLLVGFAGCDIVYGLERPPEVVPVIDAVDGRSGRVIAVTWRYSGSGATGFEVERTKLPEEVRDTFPVAGSDIRAVDDDDEGVGLKGETIYRYRVRAVLADGEGGAWSEPVEGSTLPFQTTFSWTADEQAAARDSSGWQGYCLVQRIEPARLSLSGEQVRITLRASSVGNAVIDRVTISRADPTPGADPYDSGVDLTELASALFVVQANGVRTLEPINYVLDAGQPLLIAIDFNPASTSEVKGVDNPVGATTYEKQASAEAGSRDRSGFTGSSRIFLVDRVEVV